jgi:hypothetical protein
MPFVTRSWWRSHRIVKIRERLSFDRSSHDAFERSNHVPVFGRDQRERVSCALSAPCPTDAVDVGVGSVWHIEVDHMRNTVNVETTRRNVSSHHDAKVSSFEAMQGLFALSLRAIAVQAGDTMTRVRDLTSQLIGAMFRAGKNKYRIGIGLLE